MRKVNLPKSENTKEVLYRSHPVILRGGCLANLLKILVIFFILLIIWSIYQHSKSDNYERPRTQEEIRKAQIEKHFSGWDGSHRGLTKFIKNSMNDPDSYKHVETVYSDRGDHLLVKTTFRGKNAFGGVVTNWIQAKVDLNGNLIEIVSQGP